MLLDVDEVFYRKGESLECEPGCRTIGTGLTLHEIIALILDRRSVEIPGERALRWYGFKNSADGSRAEFTADIQGDKVCFQFIDHG